MDSIAGWQKSISPVALAIVVVLLSAQVSQRALTQLYQKLHLARLGELNTD